MFFLRVDLFQVSTQLYNKFVAKHANMSTVQFAIYRDLFSGRYLALCCALLPRLLTLSCL